MLLKTILFLIESNWEVIPNPEIKSVIEPRLNGLPSPKVNCFEPVNDPNPEPEPELPNDPKPDDFDPITLTPEFGPITQYWEESLTQP